jgi:hypothetical protein
MIIPSRERPAVVKGWSTDPDLTEGQARRVHSFIARGDTDLLEGTRYAPVRAAAEPPLPPCLPGCPRCAAYWQRGAVA